MTTNKDFKRLVRARMTRTGEAYTAPRAHILEKSRNTSKPAAAPESIDYATLAGMSDRTLEEKTGCNWERWVGMLDYHGAENMRHREIATLVRHKYKVDSWWSQMVTVGYERIKRRRALGQRLDGSYEASKSKTCAAPVATMFDAWAEPRRRKRWLNEASVTLRTAIPPKSLRLGWHDGTIVAVWFTAKGADKTAVAIAHTKLTSKADADRMKQYWAERLDALSEWLSRTPRTRRDRVAVKKAVAISI